MKAEGFAFEVDARDGAARRGTFTTPHGRVDTPAFMSVATYGAVRGVAPDELRALGAQILLANTYHLHERPGEEVVASGGGLHGFTGWDGPWLTDSGGFQITSLTDRARIDEDGVTFASPLDGKQRQLTPEKAVEIQEALGSDVAMVLDECRPLDPERAGAASDETAARGVMERTVRWAERCRRHHRRSDQALFGIVQGGASSTLRRASATATAQIGFDGYAHGGLGLGEPALRRSELLAETHAELPEAAPRYAMGIGRPIDLLLAIEQGVDLFDCVIPTRHARHGVLYTGTGRIALRNARHREDHGPPDPACDCPTCARFSRAYLRHLLQANEMLGARLATLHNLRFYLRLLEEARTSISAGGFGAFLARKGPLLEATET